MNIRDISNISALQTKRNQSFQNPPKLNQLKETMKALTQEQLKRNLQVLESVVHKHGSYLPHDIPAVSKESLLSYLREGHQAIKSEQTAEIAFVMGFVEGVLISQKLITTTEVNKLHNYVPQSKAQNNVSQG